MTVTIINGGMERNIDVPLGTTVGAIRRYEDDLEEIGAPSNYNFSIGGQAVEDDTVLTPGARIAFRPVVGGKGAQG